MDIFIKIIEIFQSTLPARGATSYWKKGTKPNVISIHAPRTGSDPARLRHCTPSTDISTHAPRTGSDFARMQKPPRCLHFNPRSPHGERRRFKAATFVGVVISIHAPRTGSDPSAVISFAKPYHFNPRSPHGERRGTAARGGGGFRHFNPRSPHGERPSSSRHVLS